MDRATLKAFVTEAGNYFMALVKTGDPAAVSKARVAMRDPAGPWRHGSVYLYVWNLTSQTILFHAGFPDTYELQPLVPVARDAKTGEFILPHLIEAARSGPEGGFHEYHFDDPTDDSDSVDIPKVGYVRTFSDQVQRADGSTRQISFVVGSGFYGSASQDAAASGNAVIEAVLPQVVRAMTAGTVDAISGRVERAASGGASDAALSFGGASTLSGAVMANGQALEDGTFDLTRLLEGSSFTLPLGASGNGGGGLFGNLTLWGSGDYRSFSGGSSETVDYDGAVVSANLGFDTRLGKNLLAGMALAQAQASVDYTDSDAVTGELTSTVTSVNPYVGWQLGGGINLWAAAGYGTGEVEVDDEAAETQSSDLTQQMVAAGVSGPLMSSDEMFEGGTTSLNLKGEAAFTQAEIDGSGTLEGTTLNASRQRLVLEGVYDRRLASGAAFSPSLELGLRNDGGDGETGTGIETGAGLRYSGRRVGSDPGGPGPDPAQPRRRPRGVGRERAGADRSGRIGPGSRVQPAAGVGPDRRRRGAAVGDRRGRGGGAGRPGCRARERTHRLRHRRRVGQPGHPHALHRRVALGRGVPASQPRRALRHRALGRDEPRRRARPDRARRGRPRRHAPHRPALVAAAKFFFRFRRPAAARHGMAGRGGPRLNRFGGAMRRCGRGRPRSRRGSSRA